MRLSITLLKQNHYKWFNYLWQKNIPRLRTAVNWKVDDSVLKQQGIRVMNAKVLLEKPREIWQAPDDPKFWRPPPIEETKNYNNEPMFFFGQGKRLMEDVKQAQMLTKTQVFEGMPGYVEKLMGHIEVPDRDNLLQRYIMQAQEWDPTEERLPQRVDVRKIGWNFGAQYGIPQSKSLDTLMTNLVRLCLMTIAGKYSDSMIERHLHIRAPLDCHYQLKGDDILIQTTAPYLISSNRPLPRFAGDDHVDASSLYKLPDMFPVLPTVDLTRTHTYIANNFTGFDDCTHDHVHTIFIANKEHWQDQSRQAQAIMFCFGYAVAQAKKLYGGNELKLPVPINVQCVSMSQTTLNFTFFQLNTLDFTCDSGVKNFAWLDSGNQLFHKHLSMPWLRNKRLRKEGYTKFCPDPFDKLMAVMLYGLPIALSF